MGFNCRIFLITTLFLCSLLQSTMMSGQKSHSIYIEALGNGFLAATINYDLRFQHTEDGFGARIGIDFTGAGTIPILANYLIGNGPHKIEIGLGATIFTSQFDHAGVLADGLRMTGTIAYRLHSESGFMLKAGWTPIFTNDSSSITWPGIAIGWRF